MKVEAARRIRGIADTPGDKSISHRALLISALAEGTSEISGHSHGEDVVRTKIIMQQLGATITGDSTLTVRGTRKGLSPSDGTLYCGNSGTTMRLLMGLLGGIDGEHLLDGDSSLRQRPMDRVATPLALMGVATYGQGIEQTAPLRICTPGKLEAINYSVPVPSAQVKSALLFAALHAEGVTTISESVRTRTNTEDMLAIAGVEISISNSTKGRSISLTPSRPASHRWAVPQDPSQAAFFLIAGVIHPDAEITVRDVYAAQERTGFLNVLQRMGAAIDVERHGDVFSATSRSSSLTGTTISSAEIPSVDEVPILTVAAAAAAGTTTFLDMAELRIKESNRFQGSIELARSLGAAVDVDGDSFTVTGTGSSQNFQLITGGEAGDHRMTMATAIAGWCGQGAEIQHSDSVLSSFPGFFQLLSSLTE